MIVRGGESRPCPKEGGGFLLSRFVTCTSVRAVSRRWAMGTLAPNLASDRHARSRQLVSFRCLGYQRSCSLRMPYRTHPNAVTGPRWLTGRAACQGCGQGLLLGFWACVRSAKLYRGRGGSPASASASVSGQATSCPVGGAPTTLTTRRTAAARGCLCR